MRSITTRGILLALIVVTALSGGCSSVRRKRYGVEQPSVFPGDVGAVWAVAPAVNLSGVDAVDPVAQADLLYAQVQQFRGITAIPVNRVAEVYAGLRLRQVQSPDQAMLVCDLLGADALVVPTVTAYDPYDPPKLGASVQVFVKPGHYRRPPAIDPRELSRRATPGETESVPADPGFEQAVGMFDAANGSVRARLLAYAKGRADPAGPLGAKEYFVHMDRYCGFVWHELIGQVLATPRFAAGDRHAVATEAAGDGRPTAGYLEYGSTDQ